VDDPVRIYLREIGKVPLLTMQQEVELAKLIEKKDVEAKRKLVQQLGREPSSEELALEAGYLDPKDERAIALSHLEGTPLPADVRRRWSNRKPVPGYVKRALAGQAVLDMEETLPPRTSMGETMMLGLRLVQEGVADARFRTRFGAGLDESFGAEIAGLVRRGLLARLSDRVRLTPEGRLLGNQVFAEFLPG
jgi:hypothetical protein